MFYEFEVIGDIIGKERPRVNSFTGMIYTPNRTKDYEMLIKQYFKIKYPNHRELEGRLSVEIIAYMRIPKNTSKKKAEEMLNGNVSPTRKPDIDNIAKSALDAMNKFVFKDDNQISKMKIEKKYGEIEKIYIKVEEY